MTQPDWAAGIVKVIAREIKRFRTEQGLSAQQLADECKRLGYPIPRSVLANLEIGRRETISVPELLILAQALHIPPIRLLLPLGQHAPAQGDGVPPDLVDVAPGEPRTTAQVLKWLRGDAMDPTYDEADPTVSDFVAHDDEESRWSWCLSMADAIRAGQMDGAPGELERLEEEAERSRQNLIRIRRTMRERGEEPPPVSPRLRVDEARRP